MVTGVLIAGGQSRRMGGGDKCLLDLGGKTMLERVIDRLAPQVDGLVLNANGDPERFARFGLPIIPDTVPGYAGPLAGVLAGMRWAAGTEPQTSAIVTVSTDVPFLPLDLVERLLDAVTEQRGSIALASSATNVHPIAGLWPIDLAVDLERQLGLGMRRVLDWTKRHPSVTVDFPFLRFHGRLIDPFYNANTPEELAEARALVESRCQ